MSVRAVLVGLPGAGKTAVGRRLAKILAVPFADSDELVEAETGRTVAELFAERGEPAFRGAECTAVLNALATFDGVVSLGGGALGTAEIRAALAGERVVWLRARLETLIARVGPATTRPLLATDPPARLAALAAEREPLYAAVAGVAVDTDDRTTGQVAAAIAARLHDWEIAAGAGVEAAP